MNLLHLHGNNMKYLRNISSQRVLYNMYHADRDE